MSLSNSEWKEYKIGDLLKVNQKSITRDFPFTEIEYLDTGSITKGRIESFQTYNLSDAPSRAKRLVTKDDIIYSTVRPIQRHYGIIKTPKPNTVASTGFVVLSCDLQLADPYFIYYFLTQDDIVNYLDSVAEGSTSAYPSLTPDVIADLDILLPKLPEQRTIASILSNLDDKIDLLHQQNKTLESLAETLFRQWFPPSPDKIGIRRTGVEEADESWETKTISDIIDVRDGTHDSPKQSESGFYLITSRHMKPSGIDFSTAYKISKEDYIEVNRRSKVDKGDILFSMIGTLGLIHLVNDEPDFAIKNIGLFKSSQKTWFTNFLYLLLKSPIGQKFIYESADGSTQEYITLGNLRSFEFLYPGENNIIELNQKIEPLFSKMKLNTNQIRTLIQLRDTLLPKLMSGEVRVNN